MAAVIMDHVIVRDTFLHSSHIDLAKLFRMSVMTCWDFYPKSCHQLEQFTSRPVQTQDVYLGKPRVRLDEEMSNSLILSTPSNSITTILVTNFETSREK